MGGRRARPRTLIPSERLQELHPEEDPSTSLAAWAKSLDADEEAAKSRDRSTIGRRVVNVFLAVVVLLILYVLIGAVAFGWESIKTPAEYAATTVGAVLLPVVTLVLGYYFGTSDRSP